MCRSYYVICNVRSHSLALGHHLCHYTIFQYYKRKKHFLFSSEISTINIRVDLIFCQSSTFLKNYLIATNTLFLEQVIGINKVNTGLIFSIGQAADGIVTPLVSIGLDNHGLCGARYGRKKSWHLLGTLIIAISFPFIFISPPNYDRYGSSDSENWSEKNLVRLSCVISFHY